MFRATVSAAMVINGVSNSWSEEMLILQNWVPEVACRVQLF